LRQLDKITQDFLMVDKSFARLQLGLRGSAIIRPDGCLTL
jgi:hypothetical protein